MMKRYIWNAYPIPVHLQVCKAVANYHPGDQKGELDSEQQWSKFKGEK